jgi:zeta-carotene desaturase
LAPSFLLFSSLNLADKRGIASAMMAIATAGGNPPGIEGISMLDWLQRMKQTPAAIERFWRVVLVSALDEELLRTDARYGIEVFWKGFLANKGGYRVGIPSVPLTELYEGCREAVLRRGGEVRLRAGICKIRVRDNRFMSVVMDDGAEISADVCIAAVPHDTLLNLLPREMSQENGSLSGLANIKTSPITGVHLWYDRTVMTEPFLTLLDHITQWVFNKTLLYGTHETNGAAARQTPQSDRPFEPDADGQYLQLVISASYDLVQKSRQEIIDLCCRELAEVLPATRDAKLRKATVIKEINATFSPAPGVDRWRPAQKTSVKKLFLAGDWTRTAWPSTMEGAVRSGYLAAEALLAASGELRTFLQPDLPLEGFSKFWANRNGAGS